MEQLIALINEFWPTSAALKITLQKILHRATLPRRHWLLQPGQIADRIYFVEQGVVRGYYLKSGGQGYSSGMSKYRTASGCLWVGTMF